MLEKMPVMSYQEVLKLIYPLHSVSDIEYNSSNPLLPYLFAWKA